MKSKVENVPEMLAGSSQFPKADQSWDLASPPPLCWSLQWISMEHLLCALAVHPCSPSTLVVVLQPVPVWASCPLSLPEAPLFLKEPAPKSVLDLSQGNALLSSLGASENSLRCETVPFEPPGAQGPAGGVAGALTPLPWGLPTISDCDGNDP